MALRARRKKLIRPTLLGALNLLSCTKYGPDHVVIPRSSQSLILWGSPCLEGFHAFHQILDQSPGKISVLQRIEAGCRLMDTDYAGINDRARDRGSKEN